MAWAIIFKQLWLDCRNEPFQKLRKILKLLVPKQDQDRWYKGAASVLYTYAVVSTLFTCLYACVTFVEHET